MSELHHSFLALVLIIIIIVIIIVIIVILGKIISLLDVFLSFPYGSLVRHLSVGRLQAPIPQHRVHRELQIINQGLEEGLVVLQFVEEQRGCLQGADSISTGLLREERDFLTSTIEIAKESSQVIAKKKARKIFYLP